MLIETARATKLLRSFDFETLFVEELGWDRPLMKPLLVETDSESFTLKPVAEKRGVQVLECLPDSAGGIPAYRLRQLVERQVRKIAYEHLVIFTNRARTLQIWQWVDKTPGKSVAYREHAYSVVQSGESLLQKLDNIAFPLSAEEALTISAVTFGLRDAFDKDRVTKGFYERFKAEHSAFKSAIRGIADEDDLEWYASLMLNRLMFIYFIQRKGFLDDDVSYLRNRLEVVQARDGQDRYFAFYRLFLTRLFHEGLGSQRRTDELQELLGRVPFLNGGLFTVHELEKAYPEIEIPDQAFRTLFDFFDSYQWHLDERPLRDDNEINPDVLGYIFEKYVNQKELGAFYTREDVTGYIATRSIIPALFDAAKKECAVAFTAEGSVWGLLREDPDRYMPATLSHGTLEKLPEGVEPSQESPGEGVALDEFVASAFGPSDETWRYHLSRRKRAVDLRSKLKARRCCEINDLIPCNVDIRQLAQDAIETSEGPELVRAFYASLTGLSVLDPTCGSGAFLFAALQTLEPLYEACLERMKVFLEDSSQLSGTYRPDAFSDFRHILQQVDRHPNRRYFILKSVIMNNLFGVDILDEAVEIAKLRLFLKLVAQVDDPSDIEPLPDIDFNIQAGNALIGYASYGQVEAALGSRFDFEGSLNRIDAAATEVDGLFVEFRGMQTALSPAAAELSEAKGKLRTQLSTLDRELNEYLMSEYGVPSGEPQRAAWVEHHKPLHWFVDFYGIMKDGGFDVVIGNPPYVDYKPSELGYSLLGYDTLGCRDLYAYTIERSFQLLRQGGRMGMVVPLSLTFSRDFGSLRDLMSKRSGLLIHSSYDNIPDRIFTGAKESDNTSKANQQRVTIFVLHTAQDDAQIWSTSLLRWRASERTRLFDELQYSDATLKSSTDAWPKLGSARLGEFLNRWEACPHRLGESFSRSGSDSLVVPKTAGYYIAAYPEEMERTKQTVLRFRSRQDRDLAMILINSSAFFWFWRVYGDGFDVTSGLVGRCPVFQPNDAAETSSLVLELTGALQECTVYKAYRGVDVPNVNFNKRMDILCRIDEWIIRHVAPDLDVTPTDFLWAKSSSCFRLAIAKSDNYPPGLSWLDRDAAQAATLWTQGA